MYVFVLTHFLVKKINYRLIWIACFYKDKGFSANTQAHTKRYIATKTFVDVTSGHKWFYFPNGGRPISCRYKGISMRGFTGK